MSKWLNGELCFKSVPFLFFLFSFLFKDFHNIMRVWNFFEGCWNVSVVFSKGKFYSSKSCEYPQPTISSYRFLSLLFCYFYMNTFGINLLLNELKKVFKDILCLFVNLFTLIYLSSNLQEVSSNISNFFCMDMKFNGSFEIF